MMTKNPFIHALAAGAYIVSIVSLINTFADGKHEASLLIPMVMLSLFVLSAAVMGYLFLYVPLMLSLDGKKKEGVTFFFQTVGVFALVTAVFVAGLFFLF